ncbi:MAG: hypothetical protein ACQES4_08005 [Bacillota bacterium]
MLCSNPGYSLWQPFQSPGRVFIDNPEKGAIDMGTCGLFLKGKLKKPLIILAVFVLIITMWVSFATTTDEVEAIEP